MYDTNKLIERVILVAIEDDGLMPTSSCLDELSELTATSGALAIDRFVQKREKPHPAHYLGKGKIEELKHLIIQLDATGIICDDELTNTQLKNMAEMLDVKIIDRTMLILDIFAKHAITAEGKVQVELAQLKYSLSRLTGIGQSMSRLGAGIGTRGPGETKLETDRRHIRSRISELNFALEEIKTHRSVLREKREKNKIPVVSMIGYTNAGKSTLMNAISNAGVLAENKLFATLDTTTRKITLPGGSDVLLTDTVGFIQKLPHHLIQAFRATLEELKFADILLHIIDASSPVASEQMSVVFKTLKDLDCSDKLLLNIYNKQDKDNFSPPPSSTNSAKTLYVSAINGTGLDKMLIAIEGVLQNFRTRLKVLIPYSESQLVNIIYSGTEIIAEEHRPEGTYFELYADDEIVGRLKNFIQITELPR